MSNYFLMQIGDEENGDFLLNSGPNPGALIDAGQQLAAQYPDSIFAVKHGQEMIWKSNRKEAEDLEAAAYRLIHRISRTVQIEIAPGDAPEHLIAAGEALAAEHPKWAYEVLDKEQRLIWTNKKSVPSGEAGDAQENG